MKAVVYIHGKGGTAEEAKHYEALFPEYKVFGFDYKAQTPWNARNEFIEYFHSIQKDFDSVTIIANSIGAFFVLVSLGREQIEKAYFISPIVNMEKLITDVMRWANVTERMLEDAGTIETEFGETLSWEYLCWIRKHPIKWNTTTSILYGQNDTLQSFKTIASFSKEIGAELTIMENGEHWFHTEDQMSFLDKWIRP